MPAFLIRESQRCSTKFAESLRVGLIRFNEALPLRHEVVQATWPKPSTSPAMIVTRLIIRDKTIAYKRFS
jgi:hypothetical protein